MSVTTTAGAYEMARCIRTMVYMMMDLELINEMYVFAVLDRNYDSQYVMRRLGIEYKKRNR